MGLLTVLNIICLSFLLAELITSIFFTDGGKLKSSHPKKKKYSHLISFSPTWKLVFVRLGLLIFILPSIDYIFWKHITSFIELGGIYQWFLLTFLLPMIYLRIEKSYLKRKWKLINLVPLGISFLSVLIAVLLYFG